MQHQQLNEDLYAGDLKMLVKNIFEVDSYASKMGSDKDIVVLSFTVESIDPAKDLVKFCERGFDFVLDADHSPGELDDGKYKVFVEIERNKRVAEQIQELLNGIQQLAEVDNFKFRYHKSFNSLDADLETLKEIIPNSQEDYAVKLQEGSLNNFSNFFSNSYIESVHVDQDDIVFKKKYAEPLRMRIKEFGSKAEIYNNTKGPLMLESRDIAEVLYYTKYLGNYAINKIGTTYIIENGKFAVALEKI